MTPNQPYLLRAFYEWIVDNDLTPHIVVNAMLEGVDVPTEHIKGGQIVLNISPSACGELLIQNDWISFKARFSGVARELFVPVPAVLGIFARENGAGTVFMDEETLGEPPQPDADVETESVTLTSTDQARSGAKGAADASISTDENHSDTKQLTRKKPAVQKLQSISTAKASDPADTVKGGAKSTHSGDDSDDDPPPTPPRQKGKPSLKVIK